MFAIFITSLNSIQLHLNFYKFRILKTGLEESKDEDFTNRRCWIYRFPRIGSTNPIWT